jgi:hypothetical protein
MEKIKSYLNLKLVIANYKNERICFICQEPILKHKRIDAIYCSFKCKERSRRLGLAKNKPI